MCVCVFVCIPQRDCGGQGTDSLQELSSLLFEDKAMLSPIGTSGHLGLYGGLRAFS